MKKNIFVALDFSSFDKALDVAKSVKSDAAGLKITNELFINSILSSPITHQVNMISTALNTAVRPFQKIVGGVADGDTATIKRAVKDLYYPVSYTHLTLPTICSV